ncbi:MAG: phytanoyl-CoA dioxygenase family protein [Dermatophilaceae bacterium]
MDAADVDAYLREGFVVLRGAVARRTAEQCADRLWRAVGYDRDDPSTWAEPVRWVPYLTGEPFARAADAPALVDALDTLVGPDRWVPRREVGSFPLRFPHPDEPDDAGWHIDASFLPDGVEPRVETFGGYTDWRVNVSSKGRAALLLFLFSEIGEQDAPTRIRVGSHLDVPAVLAPYGEDGVTTVDVDEASRSRPVALATGSPGDVYVCHPFLVHAAQPHHGTRPRLMSQPGIEPAVPLDPLAPVEDLWPVEEAIRRGLDHATSE